MKVTAMLKYGFRHDPMKWVQSDTSLQGALVRTTVLNQPRAGDQGKIEQHFREVFANQSMDGSLQDPENPEQSILKSTSPRMLEVLEMGCSPQRPEVRRALDTLGQALAKQPDDDLGYVVSALSALAIAGRKGHSTAPVMLKQFAKDTIESIDRGHCPGTPHGQVALMWRCRDLADLGDEIQEILTWIKDAMEPPGCSKKLKLCEPWNIVDMAGTVTHPSAQRIATNLIPMLLRCQSQDGGWKDCYGNDMTRIALRMLVLHNLLEPLRNLSPLPDDWEIIHSIPARCEKPRNITCGDGKLWLLDEANGAAIQVSPDDGTVLKVINLARKGAGFGFAASEEFFYVTKPMPDGTGESPVYELSIETGELVREMTLRGSDDILSVGKVGRKLVLGDGWQGGVWFLNLDAPDAEPEHRYLATGMPDYLSTYGDDIWCVDWLAPSLVRTNTQGELLDWGERPFGFNAVAWDGEHLWALDPEHRRICMVAKNSESWTG
jgi:hypothetical protein